MDRLWAPWRMAYIEQPDPEGCVFCDKPSLSDEDAMIIWRGEHCFVMLNAFPYNNGHLLIAPNKHTASLSELTSVEREEVMRAMDIAVQVLQLVANPDGFNVGANIGRTAGAGIADHIHFHVVPRWNGDTNFMPVVADVKVLPEALASVWDKLYQAAGDLCGNE